MPSQEVSRQSNNSSPKDSSPSLNKTTRPSIRSQTSREKVEDASFSQNINEVKKPRQPRRSSSGEKSNSKNQNGRYTVGTKRINLEITALGLMIN